MTSAVSPIEDRVAQLLGWRPEAWTPAKGGYSAALRYVVRSGERSAFVKIATNAPTAAVLRREIANYAVLAGPYCPRLLGADHAAAQPLLIIEDLGAARWPPPWRDADIAAALAAIEHLHGSRAALSGFAAVHGTAGDDWRHIAENPAALLSRGVVSADWLARALPALIEAEAACPTQGDAVCHLDLRSDNMCLTADGVKFIDWGDACLANPRLDLGFWLPSLHFEGGPPPDAILPDAPEVAAHVAGYFAARAGLPDHPDAPLVRRVQRQQLSTALPWAQRALSLPPLQN